MKRFVIVGLGNFGATVAEALYAKGHEVIAVDQAETKVDLIAPYVTRAAVGDGTQADTLKRLGAQGSEAAVVSTGDDITASILTTLALRDLGIKEIYVKVISKEHARVMKKIGVTEVVFPERESAMNLAASISHSDTLLNYMQLGQGFSMQEMAVPNTWNGKTLRELEIRANYRVSVIAIHDVLTDEIHPAPDPDVPLKDSDTLLVAGRDEDLVKIAQVK
jgi:trk system potassium uptake protein TrkA